MKDLLLLALVILGGALLLRLARRILAPAQPQPEAQSAPWTTLTAQEAKKRLDEVPGIILLDVRTQAEYDGGHIPGAVCLPVETFGDGELTVLLPDKHAEIFVYCRSGRRSAQAARLLTDQGYTAVTDFGGILDWPYETTQE